MEANRLVEARALGLVLLGGALGTAGREGLHLLLPADGGMPWSVFLVNIVGAASVVLGVLAAGIGFRIGRLHADRRADQHADRRADPARGGRA